MNAKGASDTSFPSSGDPAGEPGQARPSVRTRDKPRTVILGGGISGLTLAWRLHELGLQADVCEAQDFVGGLAGTVRTENGAYCLDFGPHFFITQKHEIVQRITELLAEEVVQFRRSAQIHLQGRFLDYPLSARNVLFNFPPGDALAAVATYGWAQLRGTATRLLDRANGRPHIGEWAAQNFGSHLANIFFRPYTENFWKLPVERLSPDTIPTSTRLNFMKSLKLLLARKFSGEAQSLTERELVLPLRYPKRGFGMIAEAVAERVLQLGGRIHRGARVTRVESTTAGGYLVTAEHADGSLTLPADHVVSTIPIPNLIRSLSPPAPDPILESAEHLGYLSMIVLYIATAKRRLLDTSYVYYLGRPYHRLSDMNQFCAELCPADENMLAVELSCHQDDPTWRMSETELLARCLPALERDGILTRHDVRKVFVVKAASAYPIFYYDYREHLENVKAYIASQPRLHILGRTGEYHYIDSDQCMERAIELADRLAAAW